MENIQTYIKQEITSQIRNLKTELLTAMQNEIKRQMDNSGGGVNNQIALIQQEKIKNSVLVAMNPRLIKIENQIKNALIDGEEVVTEYRKKQFNPGAKVGDTYF